MLKRLYVDNYRCFVNFSLDLHPLTLLVGRNGTGKSSVLEVLFALRKLLSGAGKINDLPEQVPGDCSEQVPGDCSAPSIGPLVRSAAPAGVREEWGL